MRSVAKAALWLLLFIWAAAAFQEIGAEAEAFALEQFSSCGEAVLADVGSALSDIAYLPAHNILMTVSAGSGDIIIRAHSLSGARQIEMDVSLGGAEGLSQASISKCLTTRIIFREILSSKERERERERGRERERKEERKNERERERKEERKKERERD